MNHPVYDALKILVSYQDPIAPTDDEIAHDETLEGFALSSEDPKVAIAAAFLLGLRECSLSMTTNLEESTALADGLAHYYYEEGRVAGLELEPDEDA